MFLNQKRFSYFFLTSFSFILGCTLTLLVVYSPLLVPTSSSKTPGLKLLVLVMSAVKNKNCRDAIRDTWAKNHRDVRTLFVTSRDQSLNAEKLLHGDILEVNVPDEYLLLGHTLLKALEIVRDVNFDYLLKCDDDSFVNVPKVIDELERAPKNKYYWGYFIGSHWVKTVGGKLKKTNYILCDTYLPYAFGGGYVISKDLVSYIAHNRDYLSFYDNEEITVGVWLTTLNITKKHDQRFDTEHLSRGCQNDHLVTHKLSPETMKLYWSRMVQTGKMCDEEYFEIMPYEYNWTEVPSKCCKRKSSPNP